MVRELNARGVSVLAVPWDHDFDGVLDDYDGLFLSNGPGDPEQCAATIAELRKTLAREGDAVRPVFGICLGNQLTGLAAGAKTTKLRFGNRGQNQPVLDALHPGACMVTSQNHGFAVDDTDLPEGWRTLYTNANDGSNEGLVHASKPYFTAQFHPEANGGPTDAYYLFDVFVGALRQDNDVSPHGPPRRPHTRRSLTKRPGQRVLVALGRLREERGLVVLVLGVVGPAFVYK